MHPTEIPPRESWKQDLAPYLQPDEQRSFAQIASVVLPYLAVWILAALIEPSPPVAIALGLVATVFLIRMYSLFHDLTHNSLFGSRRSNSRWGHLLGYLLFTPYRWWQRQHAIHHAHTGDLEHRGVGEINTMTLAEYESASRLRRLGYRLYRNPVLMLLVGPSLVFLFERRFPQRGMTTRILLSVVATNVALVAWVLAWSSIVGWGTFLLIQGTTLIAGGAIAAWMLYIQHQYEDTYYQAPGGVAVRARRAAGQLIPQAAAAARVGRRQRQLPSRAPPERQDPELQPPRRPRVTPDVPAHSGRHPADERRGFPAEALGRRVRVARPVPEAPDVRRA